MRWAQLHSNIFDVADNLALSFKNCKFLSFFVLNWEQTTIYELIMYGKNMFYVCFAKINLPLFVCLLLVGFYPPQSWENCLLGILIYLEDKQTTLWPQIGASAVETSQK